MTDSSTPVRVLIVDDQALVRMGFRMVLDAEPGIEVVGEAADGRAAVERTGALAPDIVLMDVRMPGMDGIDATAEIVARHPATRVIVLTTFDLDEYAFAGLRAGASGFLVKDTRPEHLMEAIRAVADGDAAISPRVTRRMIELLGPTMPATGGAAGGVEGS
ncbi:response regulator, partial [Clavibacter michiganensis]|uniref:response regulator n=1 Tax=Clavibacter michiganensis TaxID=28447 RepID=UPI000A37F6A7